MESLAEIGSIAFPEVGEPLLPFHYNRGNHFAYFIFDQKRSERTLNITSRLTRRSLLGLLGGGTLRECVKDHETAPR